MAYIADAGFEYVFHGGLPLAISIIVQPIAHTSAFFHISRDGLFSTSVRPVAARTDSQLLVPSKETDPVQS